MNFHSNWVSPWFSMFANVSFCYFWWLCGYWLCKGMGIASLMVLCAGGSWILRDLNTLGSTEDPQHAAGKLNSLQNIFSDINNVICLWLRNWLWERIPSPQLVSSICLLWFQMQISVNQRVIKMVYDIWDWSHNGNQ